MNKPRTFAFTTHGHRLRTSPEPFTTPVGCKNPTLQTKKKEEIFIPPKINISTTENLVPLPSYMFNGNFDGINMDFSTIIVERDRLSGEATFIERYILESENPRMKTKLLTKTYTILYIRTFTPQSLTPEDLKRKLIHVSITNYRGNYTSVIDFRAFPKLTRTLSNKIIGCETFNLDLTSSFNLTSKPFRLHLLGPEGYTLPPLAPKSDNPETSKSVVSSFPHEMHQKKGKKKKKKKKKKQKK